MSATATAIPQQTPTIEVPDPADHTATRPAEHRGLNRDQVRMLVGRTTGPEQRHDLEHTRFRDLPAHLNAGDVLVLNNSATRNGQIDGVRETGEPVVVHVASLLPDVGRAGLAQVAVELREAPNAGRAVLDATAGERITLAGGPRLRLIEPYPGRASSPTGVGNRLWRAEADSDLATHLARHGRPIAYGYLDAPYPLSEYQSVFATVPGSAEMASAGRPFTADLLTQLVSSGVHLATITLHTGISSQEAGEELAPEWFEVTAGTAAIVNAAREAGGRVVAVGTTVTRALESAATGGRLLPRSGWTDHLVTPLTPPQIVEGLITGWHDPQASHLLLVEAVAGAELGQLAYQAAYARGYLWHEFGDSALLLP